MRKNTISVFTALAISAGAVSAATVESVAASQQWPWSIDIKVKYTLSDVTSPVDLKVSAINEGKTLAVPRNAISGDLYGITSQSGSFTIDPAKAFGTARAALTDLQIRIELSDSAGNLDEALYRIYDLNDGSCTDVTRRDLLNGRWGAVETDYKAIDPAFETGIDDVLIWTGVTNNPAYKTDKLVMRKVHAKDVVWQSGDPQDVRTAKVAAVGRHYVKLTYDYYVSVFEITRAQFKKIYGSLPADSGLGDNNEYETYPACNMAYWHLTGHPNSDNSAFNTIRNGEKAWFPTNKYVRDVGRLSLCAYLWDKTKYEFHLPTRAEWEYACRGGQSGVLYSGEEQTAENAAKISWNAANSGLTAHPVGMLRPNAFGLYDMLGNVMEQFCSIGDINAGGISGTGTSAEDPVVNPIGDRNPAFSSNATRHALGGCYNNADTFGAWQDMRSTVRCGWCAWHQTKTWIGARLVCPADKTWGEDWPDTVLSE